MVIGQNNQSLILKWKCYLTIVLSINYFQNKINLKYNSNIKKLLVSKSASLVNLLVII